MPLLPINTLADELLRLRSTVKDVDTIEKPTLIELTKEKKKLILLLAQSSPKNPYVRLSKTQKKKLKKKIKEETAAKEIEDAKLRKLEEEEARI